jgi:hypothetical protein
MTWQRSTFPRLEFHMFSHYTHFCIDYLKITINSVPRSGHGFMQTCLVSGSFVCELNTYIHITRKITSLNKTPGFPVGTELIVSTVATAVKIPTDMHHDSLGIQLLRNVGFVTPTCLKIAVMWGTTPCSLITRSQHFGGSF